MKKKEKTILEEEEEMTEKEQFTLYSSKTDEQLDAEKLRTETKIRELRQKLFEGGSSKNINEFIDEMTTLFKRMLKIMFEHQAYYTIKNGFGLIWRNIEFGVIMNFAKLDPMESLLQKIVNKVNPPINLIDSNEPRETIGKTDKAEKQLYT